MRFLVAIWEKFFTYYSGNYFFNLPILIIVGNKAYRKQKENKMDNSVNKKSTSEVVIAEAEKLNIATDASFIRYITDLAEQNIEEEIDKLWVVGKRPEGTYWERFVREVQIELKEHRDFVLAKMGR
jgi:hypothetical protein